MDAAKAFGTPFTKPRVIISFRLAVVTISVFGGITGSWKHLIAQFNLAPTRKADCFGKSTGPASRCGLRPSGDRAAATHIYFLLPKGQGRPVSPVIHDESGIFTGGIHYVSVEFDGNRVKREPGSVPGSAWILLAEVVRRAPGRPPPAPGPTLAGCAVAPGFDMDFKLSDGSLDGSGKIGRIPSRTGPIPVG